MLMDFNFSFKCVGGHNPTPDFDVLHMSENTFITTLVGSYA